MDLGKSLIERIRDFPGASELMKAAIPSSALELKRALETPHLQTIITTWQMLRKLGREQKFTFSCLIACFNFVRAKIPDFDLKALFPRGNFILFVSALRQPDKRIHDLFGSLIRTYDLSAAVVDGYLLPVQIECHSIATNDRKLEIASENVSSRPYVLPAERVKVVASALLDDLRGKLKFGIHQAVLVTNSHASVMAYADELAQLNNKYVCGKDDKGFVVVQLDHSASAKYLRKEQDSPIIWLSTIELLAGVDFGPSVACYVACKVSQDAKHRLFSMVARPRGIAKNAFIVDYAGNHWDSMLATSDVVLTQQPS